MSCADHRDRGQRGMALVAVIVVLVALSIIAMPYVLSMRHLEAGALLMDRRHRASAGAQQALAAAHRQLEDTHPAYDLLTPHKDTWSELQPADLAGRFPDLLPRDPRGKLRSVRIEDERGKVHLGTATLALLGNLIGGRTRLSAEASADATSLAVLSTAGLAPAGLAWVDGEQVEYSRVDRLGLEELERGFASANLPASVPRTHAVGSELYDSRLLLLVQARWHLKQGGYVSYPRVDGLRDLSRFAEVTYDADTLDRLRPLLTVHGGPTRWENPQRVLGIEQGRRGQRELVVVDGSLYGPGTVLQLEHIDGRLEWNMVLSAVDWGDAWRLALLEAPSGAHGSGQSLVQSLHREPVNLNTAPAAVLRALFEGIGRHEVLDVVTATEAALLAVLLTQSGLAPDDIGFARLVQPEIEMGRLSVADHDVAEQVLLDDSYRPGRLTLLELAAALVGREQRRLPQRVSRRAAEKLAARVEVAELGSHTELAGLLARAVGDGEISEEQRTLILRNALNPGDAGLVGGTAPFVYASGGIFSVSAAASENLPNGKERSRSHVREIVSISPPGDTARLLSTQADFESDSELGRDWVSHPAVLLSGPGPGAPRRSAARATADEEVSAEQWREALRLGESPVDRASTLAAGRPGPSTEEGPSFVSLATMRSGLPGSLHFDEGAPGLMADSPDGYSLTAGPLRLPLEAMGDGVVGRSSRLVQPFSFEFWFETDDLQAETMLFDTGADFLENRIFLLLENGELVLRVSDGSIPDFEAQMPEGRAPPAGEIRYAFDDGLELRTGVPYHVLAWIGGAKDTSMALFVDGVPRGRRSFTTRLVADLESVGALAPNSGSLGRSDRIAVETTEGFPEQGVLRIGWELVEYTSKTEDSFVTKPAGDRDVFGGRSRRGTVGAEHEASEVVELMGYARPLAADLAPQGAGSLGSRLAEFGVAELDPDRLDEQIEIDIPTVSLDPTDTTVAEGIALGDGLDEFETDIPVRSPAGGSLDGVFQADGGHAIIVCDYGNNAIFGQSFIDGSGATGIFRPVTPGGVAIGGVEIIRYDEFDGQTLLRCARAGAGVPQSASGTPSPLDGASFPALVFGDGSDTSSPRVFVTELSPEIRGIYQGLPELVRVLVIPISVGFDGGSIQEEFNPFPGAAPAASRLLQLGLDFPQGGGGTEWVRWNTPTTDFVVRDDLQAVTDMLNVVAGTSTWIMDGNPFDEGLVETMNDEFRFRGQASTEDVVHEAGETVLPVHVFGGWGVDSFDPQLGLPGRHDAVSLVGDDGEKEWHVINHAIIGDPDWGNAYALVAFRAGVVGDFARTPQTTQNDDSSADVVADRDLRASLAAGEVGERLMKELQLSSRESLADAIAGMNHDSRRFTRLLKAPSGELPDAALVTLHMGEHFDGRPAAGAARVDELRLHVDGLPGQLLPGTARFRLAEELEFDENELLLLSTDALVFPHAQRFGPLLGEDQMEVLSELPPHGGMLLIGEEIVSYVGLDPVDTGAVFLSGRGLYGTRRARHLAAEPVTALVFWPASPLASGMDAADSWVPVSDPDFFPPAGLVWIEDELLSYDRVSDDGLHLPSRLARPDDGLSRGRFGTLATNHPAGAMVRWQPSRVRDGGLLGEDVPEAAALKISVEAPGAFFTDLAVQARMPDPGVGLVGRLVLDGRASQHGDPSASADLFALPDRPSPTGLWELAVGRQASLAELHLSPRWLPGAFDSRGFASNAWKLGPRIDAVVIKHIQPTLVLEYEQWR